MTRLSDNIYIIENFLTDVKCDYFISLSEDIGYEKATVETESGYKVIEDVRNNFRLLYNNPKLAEEMWTKLKQQVPNKIGNSVSVGLNELFRFYKYYQGNSFKKHVDGSFIRNEVEASYFTFMIYLNDSYSGGETIFKDVSIVGKKGMALVFLHSLEHTGAEVLDGIKYVLRTDIMYRLVAE